MKKVLEIVSVYRYDGVYIKCVWYWSYFECFCVESIGGNNISVLVFMLFYRNG